MNDNIMAVQSTLDHTAIPAVREALFVPMTALHLDAVQRIESTA